MKCYTVYYLQSIHEILLIYRYHHSRRTELVSVAYLSSKRLYIIYTIFNLFTILLFSNVQMSRYEYHPRISISSYRMQIVLFFENCRYNIVVIRANPFDIHMFQCKRPQRLFIINKAKFLSCSSRYTLRGYLI